MIDHAILATDLAFFFKNKRPFFDNVSDLTDAFGTTDNKFMFMAMLMTLCDLNAISKPWPLQRKIAEKVSQEFFSQGDIEKHIFNVKPTDMFNRDKISELPKMQVDFINGICQPIFVQFYKIFDGDFVYRDNVLVNKFNWLRLAKESEPLGNWADTQIENFIKELKEMNIDADAIQEEANLQFIDCEMNEINENNENKLLSI